MEREKTRFMQRATQPEILASAKMEIDLNQLRADFGNNFNTLILTNTDTASAVNIYLDGVNVGYLTANNGSFSFDWQYGIKYNFLSLKNTNAGASIPADNIKITVGRSGRVENGA